MIPFEFTLDVLRSTTTTTTTTRSLAYVRRCLRDPTFSRFGAIPACDGCRLALDMINMHTKFEVSSLSPPGDILGGLKI